jgi:SAM-dependent methyltransferase
MDTAKLEAFATRMITDIGAANATMLTLVGHKVGLYRALAGAGPVTSQQLAERAGLHERYVREWLNVQAAGGYVEYDAAARTYLLPDEHAFVLADAASPMFMPPALDVSAAMWRGEQRLADAFRSGRGIGWHEHDSCLFCGVEAFFRNGYRAHLVQDWIPALDGVSAKLQGGARVADVGCGHGASTIILAQAFPNSRFHGFDYHGESIEIARRRAQEAGVGDRVTFEVADAASYPARNYDLILFMDCLHDLGDPVGAAAHARRALAEDGTVMLVEPRAGDSVEDNLHPIGRVYYAGSTALCTPHSLSQPVGRALGAQAGPRELGKVMREGGFSRFREATSTPFNLVLEARA